MAGRTLSQITESGFHALLQGSLPAGSSGPLPLGDDCAALPLARGRALLLTTDAVVEGTHFPPGAPPRLVGRMAANVNLSDLAAKGGTPLALLTTLLLPGRTRTAWSLEVLRGVEEAAGQVGAHLVGGDTKRSLGRAVIVQAVGEGRTGALMPRRGARPGDLLATTGFVGRGGASYLAWKEGLVPRRRALQDLLTVLPRLPEGRALAPYATASIDTSDGLARSLHLLTRASGVSAILRQEDLPLHPRVARVSRSLHVEPGRVAFLGGDYELLVALPPRRVPAAVRAVGRAFGRLTVIGSLGPPGSPNLLSISGKTTPLPDVGWDAFAKNP